MFGVLAATASATVRNWAVADGNINVAENWTPSGVPAPEDYLYVCNGGTASVTANASVGTLHAGDSSGGGTFEHLGGSLRATTYVGYQGMSSSQTGTYYLRGGTLDAASTYIRSPGSTFVLAGGTHIASTRLRITNGGSYDLQSGQLTGAIYLGLNDDSAPSLPDLTASFTQSGGTCSGTNVFVGYGATYGVYRLQDGVLTATNLSLGYKTLSSFVPGGTFIQTGGSCIAHTQYQDAWLQVGRYGGTGYYDMQAGVLKPDCAVVSSGSLNQRGGFVEAGFYMAVMSGGTYLQTAGTARLGMGGSLDVDGGTYRLQGGLLQAKSLRYYSGLFDFTGGTLQPGQVQFSLTNNGGVLAPGEPISGSALGSTSITGDYTQASGVLEIQLGQTGNDSLSVSGAFTRGGVLCLASAGGYRPREGDSFTIASAGSFAGSFADLDSNITNGLSGPEAFGVQVTDTNLVATFLGFTAGDANGSHGVNVGDLGILAANWGFSGRQWATGDFNADHVVNVGDLGILAANWGWTSGPISSGDSPIPEPMTALAMALGSLAIGRRRRR
jgi:hypothetical protein